MMQLKYKIIFIYVYKCIQLQSNTKKRLYREHTNIVPYWLQNVSPNPGTCIMTNGMKLKW